MGEPITADDNKQGVQKPLLSLPRIACEIFAGVGAGFVAAVPVACLLAMGSGGDCFGVGKLLAAATGLVIIPPVYALAAAVGVYLIGSRGNQTGSFLLTLCGGIVGGLGMFLLLPVAALLLSEDTDSISVLLLAFASLIPAVAATYGFNLRRAYEVPAVHGSSDPSDSDK